MNLKKLNKRKEKGVIQGEGDTREDEPEDPENIWTSRRISLKTNTLACPYCGNTNEKTLSDRGTTKTMVGSNGPDPNHHWNQRFCLRCHKNFVREYIISSDSVWYTDTGKCGIVLQGIPSCCTSTYKIPCPCCSDGLLLHSTGRGWTSYEQQDGRTVPKQAMLWKCDTCEVELGDHLYGREFVEYPVPAEKETLEQPKEETLGLATPPAPDKPASPR